MCRNAWLKIALPTVVAVLTLLLIAPLMHSMIETPTYNPSVQKKAEEGSRMIDLGTLGGSMCVFRSKLTTHSDAN